MANIYRHYKGGTYNVIGEAIHTETQEKLVVYEDSNSRIWVRPTKIFTDDVEVNGKTVPRFQHLGFFHHN